MASNQTNRFQSLDSSVEEFIDGQENENTKKNTKPPPTKIRSFIRSGSLQRTSNSFGNLHSVDSTSLQQAGGCWEDSHGLISVEGKAWKKPVPYRMQARITL